MSINKHYFTTFISNYQTKVENQRINKIIQISSCDFFLFLSSKDIIHISLNAQNPFIRFADSLPFTLNAESNAFLSSLKRELNNARLTKLSTENDDKIINISFKKTYDNYEVNEGHLILEFITNHPNIILLDHNNNIILAYKYTNLFLPRVIQKNIPYSFPTKGAKSVLESFNDEKNISNYLDNLDNKIKIQEFSDVYKLIANKKKQYEKKIHSLNEYLEQNNDYDKYRSYGDFIYENLDNISENILKIDNEKIKLDESLSLVNNANKFYKKYKKYKQGIMMNIEFLNQARALYEYFLNLEQQVKFCSLEELEDIRIELTNNGYLKSKKKKSTNKLNPYFINSGNEKILFGKNNYQNDNLTFKIANKDYYFFHIKDYSGAHVIISSSNPSKESIQLASELCLFLSNKVSGEVLLADVKDVKKAEHVGQVKIKKFSTITIKSYDKNKLDALIKNAERLL